MNKPEVSTDQYIHQEFLQWYGIAKNLLQRHWITDVLLTQLWFNKLISDIQQWLLPCLSASIKELPLKLRKSKSFAESHWAISQFIYTHNNLNEHNPCLDIVYGVIWRVHQHTSKWRITADLKLLKGLYANKLELFRSEVLDRLEAILTKDEFSHITSDPYSKNRFIDILMNYLRNCS